MSCPLGHGNTASPAGNMSVRPKRGKDPVYYHEYLQLDKVLNAQSPKSEEVSGQIAHDEMLFIIIHQTYELWFKQVLFEVQSAMNMMSSGVLPEEDLLRVTSRLRRVIEIQKVLLSQLGILETMTPMDFLDFRDYLFPASGFQSVQFRLLENKLGLLKSRRIKHSGAVYTEALSKPHAESVLQAAEGKSLFDLVAAWLERCPFVCVDGWDFWAEYKQAVYSMLDEDEEAIRKSPLTDEEKQQRIDAEIVPARQNFDELFSEELYNKSREKGIRRLSFRATKVALFIYLYRSEPIFQMPFQMLTLLQDIDENMTSWRYAHALMVQRVLGAKVGTGGSSGYHYLKATASTHKVFDDLSHLSAYMVPSSVMPVLPSHVKEKICFKY